MGRSSRRCHLAALVRLGQRVRPTAPHLKNGLVQVERVPLVRCQLHTIHWWPLLLLLLLLRARWRRRRLRAEPPPRRERKAGGLGAHRRTTPPPLAWGACKAAWGAPVG